MKVCPYCAEKIQEEAAKCRFCGEWLDPSKRPAWSLDFAALGEQLGQQLSEAAGRGEVGTEALSTIRSSLEEKLGAAQPGASAAGRAEHEPTQEGAASMASPAWGPSGEDSGGKVSAWEPPTWLAPGQSPDEPSARARAQAPAERAGEPQAEAEPAPAQPASVDRSEAPTRPEAHPAANQEPSPQFVPPGRAATAAATQPEPQPQTERPAAPEAAPPQAAPPEAAAPGPALSEAAGEIEMPPERASLEEVAARMERLKATADAVQRTLAEKAAERSASGAAQSGAADSMARVPSQPAVERSNRAGTLLQGSRLPSPEESGPSGSRKRSGTMDRLEQSILGDDRDDFGDLDSEGSGFGSTSFGDAISARRPIPWGPIAVGIAVVGVIGFFMFRDEGVPDAGATGTTAADVGATAGPDATKTDPDEAGEEKAAPPEPEAETGEAATETAEGGEPAAEGGEPAAEGGEPAAEGGQDGGEPSAEGGEGGDTPPPPADEALTEKLAEAEKAYKRRKYDAARAAIDEASKMAPNHPDTLVLLANVQLEQGEMESALATATKCVGIDATKADCWLTIAALQEASENPAAALAAWQKYVEHAPNGQYASSAKKAIKRLEKQVAG